MLSLALPCTRPACSMHGRLPALEVSHSYNWIPLTQVDAEPTHHTRVWVLFLKNSTHMMGRFSVNLS